MDALRMDKQPTYLTTKEVADLLRVKERKVYELAAADEIPHRRLTGKLLFPATEIRAWIEGEHAARAGSYPSVLVGSHDPLLEWAALESRSGLAMLVNGSFDGLDRFVAGEAALCGLHIAEDDGWNVRSVAAKGLHDCVLISWVTRRRGLILSRGLGDKVGHMSDLKGRRVIARQAESGTSVLFARLCHEAGLGDGDMDMVEEQARTEIDAAAAVAVGTAEAALGIEAMASRFQLDFVPLVDERFDLLIYQRAYFSEPVQKLLGFTRGDKFRAKAEAMGGYDLSGAGHVYWISP